MTLGTVCRPFGSGSGVPGVINPAQPARCADLNCWHPPGVEGTIADPAAMNSRSPLVTARHPDHAARKRFAGFALATVATIYALILVGGIVRATGSGMGCPDWPTCFGRWIPPTSEAQLPADYQQIYADRGYADTTFNVQKTWTEYLNRLLGVFTGFTILLTLLFSLPFRRSDPWLFRLSLTGFVLVGIQGWLGSRVVASNLHPGLITTHMLLAQVIVGVLIAALLHAHRHRLADNDVDRLPRGLILWLGVAMVVGLLQMVMGTQVREGVDLIARASDYENRHLWIDNLPVIFSVHKWFALAVVALNAWLIYRLVLLHPSRLLLGLNVALAALLLITSVIGMSMDRLHMPMVSQPLHLWFASLIFGTQLAIALVIWHSRQRDPARQMADRPNATRPDQPVAGAVSRRPPAGQH